jgi:AcrR family transcriptional regulator
MKAKKNAYHHGTLKKDMIAKGLLLLNKVGYEAVSLRKVAVLCHVSHAAPYKHFKNKEELLLAIKAEVLENFKHALEAAAAKYPHDPKNQIINLGKCYVKFMVDNPDYSKFIVSFKQYYDPMLIKDSRLLSDDSEGVFEIFKKSALNYLHSLNPHLENPVIDLLTMWGVVHGLAVLIANKSIAYSGDYLNLVEKILSEKLKLG